MIGDGMVDYKMNGCIKKKNEVKNVNGKEGSYYRRQEPFKSTLG